MDYLIYDILLIVYQKMIVRVVQDFFVSTLCSSFKVKTHKICSNPECKKEFKLYKTTDKFCSPDCKKKCTLPKEKKPFDWDTIKPRKPINKVSKKQKVLNAQYSVDRIQFLSKPENKICFIKGCGKQATTVEHQKGRKGFADEWARENNILLRNFLFRLSWSSK